MTERLENLLSIFPEKALSNRKFQVEEQSLMDNIESFIKKCDKFVQELQEECQKFRKATSGGIKVVFGVAGRRATYPFRQSTLHKLDEDIGDLHRNLSLAINVLQLNDGNNFQDDIANTKLLLDLVRDRQVSANIRDWLNVLEFRVTLWLKLRRVWPVRSGTYSQGLSLLPSSSDPSMCICKIEP